MKERKPPRTTPASSAHGDSTLRFVLPLPISKNRRVEAGVRQVFVVDRIGKGYYKTKATVRNSKAWKDYKKRVWEILIGELHFHFLKDKIQPIGDERLVFECIWYLKRKHSDCVNFHDLLADAIKDSINVDDDVFLIRDMWAYVDPDRPRVEVAMYKEKPPGSNALGGS